TAVGASGPAGKYRGLAESYTGTQWVLSSGTGAGTGANVLSSASCPIVTWCAASGYWAQAGQEIGLNEVMSGTAWAVSQSVAVLTPTTVILKASQTAAGIGRAAVLTAVVNPAPDTGTVRFSEGGAPLAGCQAVALRPGAGTATCTTVFWTGGQH